MIQTNKFRGRKLFQIEPVAQASSLRKTGPTPFCHSERSEESLFLSVRLDRRGIPRSPRRPRNDKINYSFRSLFIL